MKCILFLVGLLLVLSNTALPQGDLIKIVPPSPTLAALAKYGDIPVSYYTGTPQISIPIYEINTGDYSLPVSLSYHASGIKVEEIASWVGLGWSLNSGGIISRSIRGLMDEQGYMNSTTTSVASILAMPQQELESYLRDVSAGMFSVDMEPDMFTFNFGTHSGKFYYSQETQEIITLPRSPLFIDKEYFLTTGLWRIVTEDGTEYYFEKYEQNISSSQCNGQGSTGESVVTGWFLTKIITPIGKNEITFSYESLNYTISNIGSQTINSSPGGISPPSCVPAFKSCEAQNEYIGYRLSGIYYNKGKVLFRALTNRQDLVGDKQLDKIEIYNMDESEPSKTFAFTYDYYNNQLFNAGLSAQELSYRVRLKLTKVAEGDRTGHYYPAYEFEYENIIDLPSRLSFDQDSWGFYNGPNGNTHMVPPMSGPFNVLPGANRTVNTVYSKAGLLSKITYPTQGKSTFEYESHTVLGNLNVPFSQNDNWEFKAVHLDRSDISDEERVYINTVEIEGMRAGVFASINVNGITCSYCPEATICAVMYLEGVGNSFYLPITCNVNNVYVPKGTYVLKASFTNNNSPQTYEDFVVQFSWNQLESPPPQESLPDSKIGGVRIKRIIDEDGSGNTVRRIFNYNSSGTGKSSGSLVNVFPVYEYTLPCGDITNDPLFVEGNYVSRTSVSNYSTVTTQGSPIGYSQVSVVRDEDGENGKTVYLFSAPDNYPDEWFGPSSSSVSSSYDPDSNYPFAPVSSYDHRRGLLLKTQEYLFKDDLFKLVKSVENEYAPLRIGYDELGLHPLRNTTKGIKAAPWGIINGGIAPYAVSSVYAIYSEWVRPVRTIEQNYDEDNFTEKTITYMYANTQHQQPYKVTINGSDGIERSTYFKYPLDYSLPSGVVQTTAAAIRRLQQLHYLNLVIEKINTLKKLNDDEVITGGIFTTYKSTVSMPDTLFSYETKQPTPILSLTSSLVNLGGVLVKANEFKPRVTFDLYDSKGNLLQQRKVDNSVMSYQWGYQSNYPVMEILNSDTEHFIYEGFEDANSNTSVIAKTGRKSSTAAFQVVLPSAGTYQLTYWKKAENSSWELVETVVNGNTTIGGSALLIDEVRLFPMNAQMTTYTYDPGIGVTSSTDANNSTIYYEYDFSGRLKVVRDDKRNVVKSYDYHYKNEQ